MNRPAIQIEKLSKAYRLGQIGSGTLTHDLQAWWARLRGRPNPLLKIGQTDPASRTGDTIWALQDVSFSVEQGQVLGVIGRNGAGKSTLLKILSRVTVPTSGVVRARGRIASLLEVGTGFHPELTGRENIYLNGAILGMTKKEIRRKFDEITSFAEVEKFIDTPVKRYSSGMYVRLAFAVAAHLEPEILVVDEVLAVGDAEFQKKCLGKMKDVSNEGRTILFVSHNMGAVRSLCPLTLYLAQGKIVTLGPTDEVTRLYLDQSNLAGSGVGAARVDCQGLEHSGSGEAKIRWAQITNAAGEPTLNFAMDERIQIEFGVENPLGLNLDFAVEILDKNDYPLFHFLSEYENPTHMTDGAGKTFVQVKISLPPLALFPDDYSINLWTGLHHSRVDKVEKCFQFQMLKQAGIRRDLLTSRGRIYSQGDWLVVYKPAASELALRTNP